LGKVDDAISHYQQAIAHDPDFFEAYHQLGTVLKKQKRWADAANAFERVVELQPDFPWGHYFLGTMCLRMGKPQDAVPHLQNAIQRKSDAPQFYLTLGNALAKLDQMEEAIAAYKKTIGLDPTSDISTFELGQALRKEGFTDASIVCCRQAIQENPLNVKPYVQLQYTPMQPHQLPPQIAFYQNLQASGQECHPLIWSNLGDVLTQNNQLAEAIQSYRQGCYIEATKRSPELAQIEWPVKKVNDPHFIIIGATKCGTTSLYHYLKSHPQILLTQRKELDFFRTRQFSYGKEWYLSHFPSITDLPGYYTGEASPNYFDSVGVEQRMHDMFPNVKLIVLLRDPVDRAISAHYHLVKDGIESRSLATAIADEIAKISTLPEDKLMMNSRGYPSTVFGGLYFYKLKRWLKIFPKEQLLILKSEDFFRNTQETMQQVYDFLDIPGAEASKYGKYNVGSYASSEGNAEVRQTLRDFFQPHTQRLEEYLGVRFGWES
jgi:tetratricopeptide (TPR) repeat protein